MKITVLIQGREAIPVRAIPLLTDWKEMTPDAVAEALAGNNVHFFDFEGLCAYRIEAGETKPIRASWWQGFAVRDLKALSDRIKSGQVTHEAGHQQWRKESLAGLPAGVFVWKDEYVPMYESRFGPYAMSRILGRELTPPEIQARELDFDPFLSAEYAELVKEGFECQQENPKAEQAAPATEAAQAAPVVEAPDPMKPVQRGTVQDAAIIDAIRKAGHDPLSLPKNEPGKPGVKAAVRLVLVAKHPAFPKEGRQFDKAWERLRSLSEIADLE